jgi:hypothetical protein
LGVHRTSVAAHPRRARVALRRGGRPTDDERTVDLQHATARARPNAALRCSRPPRTRAEPYRERLTADIWLVGRDDVQLPDS